VRRRARGPAAALAAVGAVAALAAGAPPTALAGVPIGCPRTAPRPLPPHALARAKSAALREAHALYRSTDLRGVRAVRAVLAGKDRDRGGYAAKCGGDVRARTVVVYLRFPAEEPSASLSEGVVLIARFRGGMRVWALLH
jgi:hypothetical protein